MNSRNHPWAGFWNCLVFLGVGKKWWKKGIYVNLKDFWNFAEIFLWMREHLDGFLLISGEQNELE